MQNSITLAVVIPNYNYARFLPETLDSVLAQEPKFDEIVVVDDGSTDNSQQVLSAYKSLIKVVTLPNGGQLGACREGIRATASEYIYTLDADDIAAPGLVAKLLSILAKQPAKVQFQLSGVDAQGISLGSTFPIYPPKYDAAAMRRDDRLRGTHVCPPTSGNVFSRLALEQLPLDTYDPRGTIDGSPMFAMPYIGEVISLTEPLAFYRVHTGGMSIGSKPTTVLLLREIELFHKAWNEAIPALRPKFIDFNREKTLFVLERQIMISALKGEMLMSRVVYKYISSILKNYMSPRQKLVFGLWAVALLIPFRSLKRYLVEARRSSFNRPRLIQTLVARFTGGQHPEPAHEEHF